MKPQHAFDRLIVQLLPLVPRRIVGRASSRYIAGADLEAALAVVKKLDRLGFGTTVDVLGEFVNSMDEALAARRQYEALLDGLSRFDGRAQVSVKLTQFGLKLDPDACAESVALLIERAQRHGSLVTIDMEDSSCTDATLDLFEKLHQRSATRTVGAVLQARLRRSRADLERLLPLEPHIRICKGIYVEPREIAFHNPERIRQSFVDLVDAMLLHPCFVGIATHDQVLVERSLEIIRQRGVARERYEFQMLLGVREDLRRRLLADAHPVRIYVPYGQEWYAYSIRRLKENPAIAGYVFRSLLSRN